MRLVRFLAKGSPAYGILSNDELLELGEDGYASLSSRRAVHRAAGVRLLAPCVPTKVVAVGLNYRDHARELGMAVPETPVLFLKPPTTVIGPDDDIRYPAMSRQVDYEGELGIVIKDRVSRIAPAESRQHILGYTCANDVTARDSRSRTGSGRGRRDSTPSAPLVPGSKRTLIRTICRSRPG